MNRRIAEDKVGISLRRPEHVARREAAISLPRPEAAIQTDAGLMVSDRDGPLQDGGLHCNAPCPPAVRKVFQLWAIKRNTPRTGAGSPERERSVASDLPSLVCAVLD